MRFIAGLVLLASLAACAGEPPGPRPEISGGSRDAGIVTLAATSNLYSPAGPDWQQAAVTADRRCRAWGHEAAGSYSGWQEACRIYDRHGRCVRTEITRFYPCSDGM